MAATKLKIRNFKKELKDAGFIFPKEDEVYYLITREECSIVLDSKENLDDEPLTRGTSALRLKSVAELFTATPKNKVVFIINQSTGIKSIINQ